MADSPHSPSTALPNPRKWTTQVNIAIIVAVVVVLVIGLIVMLRTHQNPPEQVDPAPGAALFPLFPLHSEASDWIPT
jgi:hypothetical protein